ncbi:MAG: cobalamin-dependent protein [Anaerolineaceae bacterium]|nr:cobalamin-dependent protein [Anaerolineaceae bacterium]
MNKNSTVNNSNASLVASVADLKEDLVLELVKRRIASQDDPLTITEACQEGLRQVGERYENQEYFLSGLIMAGEIFRQVMELLQPIIEDQISGSEQGQILIGTVRGDIHDIGKNNLSMLLKSYGFTVHDLGVDVAPVEFFRQAMTLKPQFIGLSGLLTSAYDSMKETIRLIRTAGDESVAAIPIVIGGNQLNEEVCRYVGADYWVNDAMMGVRLFQKIMAQHEES